ncbi:MAG: hypothetical protein HKN23_02510 [Verrucomicrobiales bacterium]|nr:hypothetical protein [Verrucomicrobiales bacterium]
MKPVLAAICLLCATTFFTFAQEPERKVPQDPNAAGEGAKIEPKEKPRITKIGDSRFKLGEIEFDAKTKEIFIPTVVNKREGGPIEYLLVHENGKIHESILVTDVSPLHLQIVLKLLKYKGGYGNVFDPLLPAAEQVGTDLNNGQQLDVVAKWTPKSESGDGESPEPVTMNLCTWIIDGADAKPMPVEPWTYTGSEVRRGNYMAEVEGSLIATYLDPVAIFNMTRKGADRDDRWGANGEAIPEIGQRVTVILKAAGGAGAEKK